VRHPIAHKHRARVEVERPQALAFDGNETSITVNTPRSSTRPATRAFLTTVTTVAASTIALIAGNCPRATSTWATDRQNGSCDAWRCR